MQVSTQLYLFQVLRDQGLGKYCDPEVVRAASREMQEAMDMTPEEFDEAAHRLLQAEQDGSINLPAGAWDGEEDPDETVPLRTPPARFILPERQPGDQGGPQAPGRINRTRGRDETRPKVGPKKKDSGAGGGGGSNV